MAMHRDTETILRDLEIDNHNVLPDDTSDYKLNC